MKSFLKDTFNSRNPLSAADIERRTERAQQSALHSQLHGSVRPRRRAFEEVLHALRDARRRLMPGCSYNNLYRHKDERFFPDAEPVSPAPVKIENGPALVQITGRVSQ